MKLISKRFLTAAAAGALAASGFAQNAGPSNPSPSSGGSTSGSNSTLGSKVPESSAGSSLPGVASSAPAGKAAAVSDTLFERLDANHDGVLSKEEFSKLSTMTGSLESGTTAYPSHGSGKGAAEPSSSGVKPGSVPQ